MPSTYGKRHGLPGFDSFRTGLTFAQVQQMLHVDSNDRRDWKRKSRGVVLGLWHSLKLEMYWQAMESPR